MSISIKAIPMPAIKRVVPKTGPRGSKYDLLGLRPNTDDCIVLEGDGTAEVAKKNQSKLSSAVANARKANPALKLATFTIRSFEHEGQHMAGVWRLADKVEAAPADAAE